MPREVKQKSKQKQTVKQSAKQQTTVKVQIGELPKRRKRTIRKKTATTSKVSTTTTVYQPPPPIIQPIYQPLYPTFTPSIPSYNPPILAPIPPIPEPEKPLPERPEIGVAAPAAVQVKPEKTAKKIGKAIGKTIVAGLGALGSLTREAPPPLPAPVEITELPPPRRPIGTQTTEPRTRGVGTEPTSTRTTGTATEITEIPQRPEIIPAVPKRELVEVRTGLGQIQLMEQERLPAPEPKEPPRLPTEEEKKKIREARLKAIPQVEPPPTLSMPPAPAPTSAAPTSFPLTINSFTYNDLYSVYAEFKRMTPKEDFVPIERGKGKPTKKQLYDYFDNLGMLDIVYENR